MKLFNKPVIKIVIMILIITIFCFLADTIGKRWMAKNGAPIQSTKINCVNNVEETNVKLLASVGKSKLYRIHDKENHIFIYLAEKESNWDSVSVSVTAISEKDMFRR